ncbi:glutamine amidotransferase [Erysipelothrix larvae]|uniref:Glutamine amidotransferase n=1 Tax=Erysipelothrix larvae TaxID=1514105 RepID=A0A0X8H0B4_9FIRM|nr:gamma-glutamyl-gamma-aminobutyrate hydrolase family protein [Erysipelothrix larvae]AMC93745.1 glutamine amidotransferase [Erysipelothrix larvae]
MIKVGISGSITVEQGPMFAGYRRVYVSEDYVGAVVQAGGVPFVLPIIDDEASVKMLVDSIDALVLSGGHDVTPQLYGQQPKQKLQEIYPRRDTFDRRLLEAAEARNIPILAICRGFQVMNVYHGGTLHQDLSYANGDIMKHMQGFGPDVVTHDVDVVSESLLHKIVDVDSMMVNSFHHQIVDKVAPTLKVSALAQDGVVEALENPKLKFELAVQFHPEMLHRNNHYAKCIFKAFIDAAKGNES